MQVHPEIGLGIIGTGAMGANHTRIAAALPACRLVGVYDADVACMERVARQYATTAYPGVAALCAAVSAVIVATPAIRTRKSPPNVCARASMCCWKNLDFATVLEEAGGLSGVKPELRAGVDDRAYRTFQPGVAALQSVLPCRSCSPVNCSD